MKTKDEMKNDFTRVGTMGDSIFTSPQPSFVAPHAPVVAYVTEEVSRQGHDVRTLDGLQRVGWMLDGWSYALGQLPIGPMLRDAISIGQRVEPIKNKHGARTVGVRVGSRVCPPHDRVLYLLDQLWQQRSALSPLEFYKEFEEVHPFVDGNGRTGKIILNWLNGTLLDPIFPPSNLWGREIRNP